MESTNAHLLVYFSGRVQGVGFRYMALQVAKGFEVRGRVRNLPDGRVELEAEGEDPELRVFLAEVEEQLEGYIREREVRWSRRHPRFETFSISP